MYTREQIADLADDYALVYVTNHTAISTDSEAYRALVNAFREMAREVVEEVKQSVIGVFEKRE